LIQGPENSPQDASNSTGTALLQRTASQLSFDWSTAPPVPGFPTSNFMAQWKGFLTPPAGGNYTFGFVANDTAAVYLGGSSTPTYQVTGTTGTATTFESSPTVLAAGATPITVQFTDATDVAHLQLWVQFTPAGGSPISEIVPATWFTKSVQTLPGGWAGSQPLVGDAAAFVSEQNLGGSIVFTDTSGATHTYTQTLGGTGYTPPPGEDGSVTLTSGLVNFTDETGTVYVFTAAGTLQSTTGAADIAKPASPYPSYNSSGQLVSITDPLSNSLSTLRQVVFTYATASNSTTGGVCAPPASGNGVLVAPPLGYLCQLGYPDGTFTQLYYDTNG
jgi:hypothetical protein